MENNKAKLDTHPFFALSIILVIVGVAANFIPSGQFVREEVDGRTVVDPNSFIYIDNIGIGIGDFFLSFYNGFIDASSLMAMVLFIGGAFGVVKGINLLDVSATVLVNKLKNTGITFLTTVIMLIISLQVAITGVWELSLVMIPLIIPICLKLGYDAMTGAALVLISSCVGLSAAFTNPFFTAIAQEIAELPLFSGMWFRIITYAVFMSISIFYVVRYAKKVKNNPSLSLVKEVTNKHKIAELNDVKFTPRLIRAGVVFVLMFSFLIYGTVQMEFSFPEISAVFVAAGLFTGLAYGARLNEICHMFANGMKDLLIAALVIFFARAILYLMESSMILDTIISVGAALITDLPAILAAPLIFIIQSVINFLIPSASGQAVITMPIITPLADIAGLNRQVAVYASQLGDGLSNFIWPTNGAFLAVLAVAGIPYRKWFRFFFPLFMIIVLIAIILVVIAHLINLGPF
ncbi:YfcC family protein [Oceanobacillus oncorhynchi subsp. oncorhynchi]|uniref:YfcC family protein n=1 Tax=Oceanobacillus TaxID=182709 RepID=UPI0030D83F16